MLRKRVAFREEGLRKRSFAMPYGGGMIWFEHLDALGRDETAVLRKLTEDALQMARPSAPKRIAVVLHETYVTLPLCRALADVLTGQVRHVAAVAFVGLHAGERCRMHRVLRARAVTFACHSFDDLEAAKAWLMDSGRSAAR